METTQPIPFERWTVKRKSELVLELIKGQKKLVDVSREKDLKQSELEDWMKTLIDGGERSLKVNAEDEQQARDREIKDLRAKVGELVLELDFRKKLQALTDRNGTLS